MPLPPAQARTHAHTRHVTYRGYHREDGLWDIEAELTDTKTYALERTERGVLPAGMPVHGMSIRVTVGDDLVIREIAACQDDKPFSECDQGIAPMQAMVGATLGPGWRQAIEKALGNQRGCTHLREMLFNMATAAFQTIPAYQSRLRRQAGVVMSPPTQPPYHLGKCIGWAYDGAVVVRHYPQFAGWEPKKKITPP
jgi:hypothetical protein